MRERSDEQLVILVLNGEQEAFSILVERYQKQIFSLALKLSGDREEACDMAQECFLKIYSELSGYDSSRKFFSWMYRVAYNVCLNQLRKRPKEQLNEEEMTAVPCGEELSPEHSLEKREQMRQLHELIMSLPETYLQPMLLHYSEGLSGAEIAERLSLSVGTVDTRLHRGRKLLRERLDALKERDL